MASIPLPALSISAAPSPGFSVMDELSNMAMLHSLLAGNSGDLQRLALYNAGGNVTTSAGGNRYRDLSHMDMRELPDLMAKHGASGDFVMAMRQPILNSSFEANAKPTGEQQRTSADRKDKPCWSRSSRVEHTAVRIAGAAVGKRIEFIEPGHESRHERIIKRRSYATHVDLCQMVLHAFLLSLGDKVLPHLLQTSFPSSSIHVLRNKAAPLANVLTRWCAG